MSQQVWHNKDPSLLKGPETTHTPKFCSPSPAMLSQTLHLHIREKFLRRTLNSKYPRVVIWQSINLLVAYLRNMVQRPNFCRCSAGGDSNSHIHIAFCEKVYCCFTVLASASTEREKDRESKRERDSSVALFCISESQTNCVRVGLDLHQWLMCVCVRVSESALHDHVHRLIALKLHTVIPVLQNYSKVTSWPDSLESKEEPHWHSTPSSQKMSYQPNNLTYRVSSFCPKDGFCPLHQMW
jgi:hypothetical protein